MSELAEDAPLTAEEVLTFGPCVEAQVWTPVWLRESRAPIAVAAGRPKLGKVFNEDGVGKMVAIRPCMSRGRRVRGLPPIYTPQMLEANAGVFDGWPMFMDHADPKVVQALAKMGRSVKELGGQVLKGRWSRDYVSESDHEFGYQKGGTICEVWATPLIRKTVDNNPNLLHTSINAWPTSGKPGPCPWRPAAKGMLIEGIRRQPQGSVDYVVRGGAGGRLLVAESLEEEGAWPETGVWSEDDVRVVVSLAEQLYASRPMSEIVLPSKPEELREWAEQHAPHLLPALREGSDSGASSAAEEVKRKTGKKKSDDDADDKMNEGITTEDVRRIIQESMSGMPSVDEFEQRLREQTQATIAERDEQRELARFACDLIESAEGILPSWKKDLKARYTMLPEGPPATLLVEEAVRDDQGNELSEREVIKRRVTADLDHCRDLIAEAAGKPRVKGEGGAKADPSARADTSRQRASERHWRKEFAAMGLAESADKALEVFGGKVEG